MRFSDEGGAKRALDGILAELNEGESPTLCGSETTLTILEGNFRSCLYMVSFVILGDEELKYWEKQAAEISKKKSQKQGRGRNYSKRKGNCYYSKQKRCGQCDMLFITCICIGGHQGTKRVRSETSSEGNEEPSQKSTKND